MKRILLVDDDPVVLRIYKQGLGQHDLFVETAEDGFSALKYLRSGKPDLVVLDLMMPKFGGVEVLRFIRSQADLQALPVIVLSNSYMNDLGSQAAKLGVQKALLKVSCTPAKLASTIEDVLAGRPGSEDLSELLAAPNAASPVAPAGPSAPAIRPEEDVPKTSGIASPAMTLEDRKEQELRAKARNDFVHQAPETCVVLRDLCRSIIAARTDSDKRARLEPLYGKVHFMSAEAGLANCQYIAQMGSAFEALLFELLSKPAPINPSVMRTVVATVDFLVFLVDHARDSSQEARLSGLTLVVDDDPLSNRLVVAALRNAHLDARSTEDPLQGLKLLSEQHYALILLDIEMPGMDGFELCKKVRAMRGYEKTPVIYVTSHSDFETRAKSLFHGADDLIAKPVFPLELAVKAVGHLLKGQLSQSLA